MVCSKSKTHLDRRPFKRLNVDRYRFRPYSKSFSHDLAGEYTVVGGRRKRCERVCWFTVCSVVFEVEVELLERQCSEMCATFRMKTENGHRVLLVGRTVPCEELKWESQSAEAKVGTTRYVEMVCAFRRRVSSRWLRRVLEEVGDCWTEHPVLSLDHPVLAKHSAEFLKRRMDRVQDVGKVEQRFGDVLQMRVFTRQCGPEARMVQCPVVGRKRSKSSNLIEGSVQVCGHEFEGSLGCWSRKEYPTKETV